MEESEVNRLIDHDNQKEWRCHILKGQNKLFDLVSKQNEKIIKLALMQRIWNGLDLISIGTLATWFQSKIK